MVTEDLDIHVLCRSTLGPLNPEPSGSLRDTSEFQLLEHTCSNRPQPSVHLNSPGCSQPPFSPGNSPKLARTQQKHPVNRITSAQPTEMTPLNSLLSRWHRLLGLQRHPKTWYRDRLREELGELRAARSPLERLSETSDVFYTLSRSRHDGFPTRSLPPFSASRHALVYAYLLCKFTSRWKFYRVAARLSGSTTWRSVRECVNPAKDSKAAEVAARNDVDPVRFRRVCQRLRRWWPLFP